MGFHKKLLKYDLSFLKVLHNQLFLLILDKIQKNQILLL